MYFLLECAPYNDLSPDNKSELMQKVNDIGAKCGMSNPTLSPRGLRKYIDLGYSLPESDELGAKMHALLDRIDGPSNKPVHLTMTMLEHIIELYMEFYPSAEQGIFRRSLAKAPSPFQLAEALMPGVGSTIVFKDDPLPMGAYTYEVYSLRV